MRFAEFEAFIDEPVKTYSSGMCMRLGFSGEQTCVVIHYRAHPQVADLVFGIAILCGDGLPCYGSNTDIEEITLPSLGEEDTVEILLERLDLIAGTYFIDDVAVLPGMVTQWLPI